MTNRTDALATQIEQLILKSDANSEKIEQLAEELLEGDDALDAIEPILRIMEANEDTDFGMPGPLVHFMERFYKRGYEALLLESVKRRATPHTLWMLNRIFNDADVRTKTRLLALMATAKDVPELSDATRAIAADLHAHQSGYTLSDD